MRIARRPFVSRLKLFTLTTNLVFVQTALATPYALAKATQGSKDEPVTVTTTAQVNASSRLTVDFTKFQLDNGLEVILHQDSSQPFVAVNTWYHIGPVNEPAGRSGFAHLFEHLMFAGSKYVGPNFDLLLEGVGATNSNGSTSWDRTNYFEAVPREHLELVLWIESDRMGFLRETITEAQLNVQRDVVKNERRQSYENAPYGPSTLALLDTVYPEGHPYHGAIIGSMKDLTAAALPDVHGFAEQYYAPSNATLCIAGDFDPTTIRALVEKYFGPLRKVPKVKMQALSPTKPPPAKRIVVDEPVAVAKVTFGWVTPPAYSPSHAPLTVLAALLAGGKATRLYRNLVVEQHVALDVDAQVDANALSTLFEVDAMATQGTSIETLEARLHRELYRIVESPPTLQELQRAKKRLKLDFIDELALLNGPGGETGRAGLLQRYNHYLGDPGAFASFQDRLEQVSSADLVDVVKSYLSPATRTTVVTHPVTTPEMQP
jgi:zinc protease